MQTPYYNDILADGMGYIGIRLAGELSLAGKSMTTEDAGAKLATATFIKMKSNELRFWQCQ